ncbi:outer membrane protein assembly factor BamA [Acidobacteriota bacterium]
MLEKKKHNHWIIAFGLLALSASLHLYAAGSVLNRIEVKGNDRIETETILFYSSLQPGDPLDTTLISEDIRRLWETGFFDDIKVDVEELGGQLVLTFIVKERPIVNSVEFDGSKELTSEAIRKELKDKDLEIIEGKPVDLARLEQVKSTIGDMLEEKGFRFSKVGYKTTDLGEDRWAVNFDINDGGKVKIEDITFSGNQAFKDDKLQGTFEKTKEHGFWSFVKKGDTYDPERIQYDLENLREFYFNNGYIRFNVGEPEIEVVEKKDGERNLHINVPVEEGAPYMVANVYIKGNELFSDYELNPLIRVQPGKLIKRQDLIDTRQAIEEKYGEKGYINASPNPVITENEDGSQTVDVTLDIVEGEQVRVNRIEFKGNTTTKDKVIRRQLRIQEGEVFNTRLFRRSLLRIYQTGFFGPPNPRVEMVKDDPSLIDLTIELEEQGKNDIRFGGGVSGVEGFFGTFAFSTRNFLGTGNSLTIDIQTGSRTKNYRVLYLDPFIMDRPITLGVDAFMRKLDYTQYDREGVGGTLTFGTQFTDFVAGRVQYSYEDVEITNVDPNLIDSASAQALLQEGNWKISSLTPSFIYTSVDNPMDPFKGFRQLVSVEWAGGILGGETNFYKPRISGTMYLPFSSKMNFAFHGEYSFVKGYGDKEIPIFERFFIGGEQSIRGYETRSISPIDENGNLIGGTKVIILNTEYQIKIAQPFRFVTFFDAGQTWAESDSIGVSDFLYSMGVEFRFYTPIMQAPLRLIYAYIPKPLFGQPNTDFTFSIGTTF